MMAPGGGAGNIAGAKTLISKIYDVLKSTLTAFPNDSKEGKSVLRALNALQPFFGTGAAAETGTAAGRQFINMGAPPSQLAGTPSPGIQSGPLGRPPPMGPPPMAGGTPPNEGE